MMLIQVITPEASTTKDKGDLLENFARRFLKSQSYEVETEIRVTASELDLLCRHKVNGRTIYVECKAHRENLSSNVLTGLLGTVTFNNYEEGWLVSSGPLGKDAKGFKETWEIRPVSERQRLSIYTPERIIESFIDAGIIRRPPSDTTGDVPVENLKIGDWTLLVSPFGFYWTTTVIESGVPSAILAYDAETGRIVTDSILLKRLASTDSSFRNLDFEYLPRVKESSSANSQAIAPVDAIVEVASGDSWIDYRPARPKDFVGRANQQETIFRFLDDVRNEGTSTRVFAITGDSGMGKSSLVAKVRDRTRNTRYRRKFFTYALDVRSAKTSSYVLAALLAGLRAAARSGFGNMTPEDIVISDYADPLASDAVQSYLTSLKRQKQIVCIIFDQFEELYSKPELFQIFEESQRLFLSAIAACSNLVLGFAWRTDSTVPQDHPAYYMWHRLADHRIEIGLGPFTTPETKHAVTLFEKELGHRLHPQLRRQVIESSRGYPWFLKKLCIHIYEQLEGGTRQSELRETIDAAPLFERDLQQLTQPQQACLRAIAQSAPADWFEILEVYGADVLRALQDRRLVVKSGDRINVYWDIFRDYLLTRKTPPIPFTYLPASPSLDALLRVAAQLRHGQSRSITELGVTASLAEKSVGNVVRDLRMFGIATGDHSSPQLDPGVPSAEAKHVLERIREVLRRHALTLKLMALESGTKVTLSDIADELRQLNPTASHRPETWRFYAEKLALWLSAAGFLVHAGDEGWDREDLGSVVTLAHVRRVRTRGVFTGESPPASTIEALAWMSSHPPQTYAEHSAAGYRNAVSVLSRFGIIIRGKDGRFRISHEPQTDGWSGIVWRAVKDDECVLKVVEMLRKSPSLSGLEIGSIIGTQYAQDWSQPSKFRVGNALRRWAEWFVAGKGDGTVPDPPEGRTKRRTTSKTPHRAIASDTNLARGK